MDIENNSFWFIPILDCLPISIEIWMYMYTILLGVSSISRMGINVID